MSFKETEDLFRLYVPEWVVAHTITVASDTDGRPAFDQARDWIEQNLTGRVHEQDIQLVLNTDGAGLFWAHIKVFRDNLKGEFRYRSGAARFAEDTGFEEYTIVARNSKHDHEIRSYGVKKL
jgi:hypothetical protein